MKCRICGSVQIKGDCQYINGYYYHNHCIEKLTQENSRLTESLKNASSNYTKYIQERDNKIKRVTNHCYQQIFDLQTGWFTQDMETTIEVSTRIKVYKELLNILEGEDEK